MGSLVVVNSRAKGKVGELEFAALLRKHGFDGRRGQQFAGGADSPDVVSEDLDCYHFEVKRVQKGSLYDWLDQASKDASKSTGFKVPVVAHRKNNKKWVAILDMDDFLCMVKGLLRGVTPQ